MKFAVIGHPIKHSLSPLMHHANFKALQTDDEYAALHIDPKHFHHLRDIIQDQAIDGFNITIPYKVDMLQVVDVVDTEAQMIGAINTVHIKDGVWYGYNTDGAGFKASIENYIGGKNIVVLGAGGASRAICYTLFKDNKVTVLNRNTNRVADWPFQIEAYTYDMSDAIKQADIVINTTPVGMDGFMTDDLIDISQLKPSAVVCDIIYTPDRTPILQSAAQRGLSIINGLDMFVNQGALSYEIWTEKKADKTAMKQAVINYLQRSTLC
ncbi:shikimate dehydrogenase [Macrococcus armenti]|uniref:shikimate dehydrogenase n=1 Tax=Macrococcus armenti TaxID=2875764 RepID=UPI001CCEB872|nr:shikimate dehydrogenase [Macrococcus armenti]UBH12343.1 shikimate dehydrogenase [Macrococcus armenti]UBH21488.1 shikimate dehydrogenase [Macrococcus armenti]